MRSWGGTWQFNPSIIRFFRHPKLSENAGYGIDKMLRWKSLTGKNVLIKSDLLVSTVVYPLKSSHLSSLNEGINKGIKSADELKIADLMKSNSKITSKDISAALNLTKSKVERLIASMKKRGFIKRVGSNKGGHWEISPTVYHPNSSNLSSQNKTINEL